MPSTYTLIKGETLTGSAASYSFTAIPSTFTDLVVKVSARTDTAANIESCYIQFNGDTATNYSYVLITGNGSSASSNIYSNQNYIGSIPADAATATSNTFASWDIYIPSYLISQNKPISVIGAQENNNSSAFIRPTAGLWRNSAAITSTTITPTSGGNFVAGSSFYLYGIKNS